MKSVRLKVILTKKLCLTPSAGFDIFMDNYFTYLCLLTLLGVNKIRAAFVFNKSSLHKQLPKKGKWAL